MNELLARKSDALKVIAKYLGGNYGVELLYDPMGRCMTNGKQIMVPMMSDETYEEYEDFLVGVIFHETGHIVHTDFEIYKNEKNTIIYSLLNSLDDYRVEKFRKEDFYSAAYELKKLYEFATARNKIKIEEVEYDKSLDDDPSEMLWAITSCMSLKLNNIDYSFYPERICKIVDGTEDILEEYKAGNVLRDVTDGTKRAHQFAIKLESRLRELIQLQTPPKAKDEDKQKTKNQEGKNLGNKDKKENQNKLDEGTKDKNKEGQKIEVSIETFGKMKHCKPKDIYHDIKREIKELVITNITKNLEHHIPHPKVIELDQEEIPACLDSITFQREYNLKKEKVQKEIESMKSRMLSLLMAQKRVHFLPDSDHGEIDIASLYSIRNGNKRIFERHAVGRRMNTAVEILIDCSGSMSCDERCEGAIKAGIACGETLHSLAIPFEITGFTTGHSVGLMVPLTHEELMSYNRFEPLKHLIFKEFNENFSTVRYRIMRIGAFAGNGDPESVWWAACRLSKRREQRKILIVLSDGRPAMSSLCDVGLLEKELKKVVRKIIKTGIEIYGIGIYTDAPKNFYPDWSVINRDGNIATAVFDCLSKKLINGAIMNEI
jgi:cobalamin biosynthesis protein CobT